MVQRSNKRAAFMKSGGNSGVNAALLRVLTREFPEFRIDVIDVWDEYVKNDVPNLLACIKEYGMELLLGRKRIACCKFRTTYIFRKIRDLLGKRLADRGYSFSLQTQSLFDASVPGVPHFVYTDHTHLANLYVPGFSPKALFSAGWIALERTIYTNAALNFTMSSDISQSLIEQYSCPPDKVVCVYAGSNLGYPETEVADVSRYSEMNILFVGVDWERKGGPQLVEAFEKVLKVYPKARLTIVGCSPRVRVPNCNVVGRVILSEMGKYYEHATVFCLPSKLEPFGLVFLEAMAYSLPIVATNVGAIPDLVKSGENGYLVPPNNAEELADRLIELIGDPVKCQAFGQKGHCLAKNRYTWEKTGARIRENIEHFIEN